MRTSVLGTLDFNGTQLYPYIQCLHVHRSSPDLDKVIKNTLEISAVTHADPRCAASCVAMTTAVAPPTSIHSLMSHLMKSPPTQQLALMLQGKYDPMKKHDNKALVEKAMEVSLSP